MKIIIPIKSKDITTYLERRKEAFGSPFRFAAIDYQYSEFSHEPSKVHKGCTIITIL